MSGHQHCLAWRSSSLQRFFMHTAQHQVQRVSHLEKSKNGIVLIVDPSGIIAFWTLSAWRAKPRSCGKRSCKNCVLKKGRVLKVLNLISKRWKNQKLTIPQTPLYTHWLQWESLSRVKNKVDFACLQKSLYCGGLGKLKFRWVTELI